MKVDKNKCVSCGKCAKACKMDVDVTKTPNHTECIRCGMCIRACPTNAVRFRYGFGDGKKRTQQTENKQHGGNKMNMKKLIALVAGSCCWHCLLAACGTKDNDKKADGSGDGSVMTDEPKNAEEALATAQRAAGAGERPPRRRTPSLWEKVFMEADKGMTMQEDGKNYGDFLLDTIEAAKDQFTDNGVRVAEGVCHGDQQYRKQADRVGEQSTPRSCRSPWTAL